ncbi:MAG: class I SAM-dependent methyltransferase, partial [Methylophilaceae bacterium]
GYCSQAQFLLNCGLLDLLAKESSDDIKRYTPIAAAVQKLLSPAEMGDLFKAIAFTKGLDETVALIGFMDGDKSHTL